MTHRGYRGHPIPLRQGCAGQTSQTRRVARGVCRHLRPGPHLHRRDRTRGAQRWAGEYRENRQGAPDFAIRTVPGSLTLPKLRCIERKVRQHIRHSVQPHPSSNCGIAVSASANPFEFHHKTPLRLAPKSPRWLRVGCSRILSKCAKSAVSDWGNEE